MSDKILTVNDMRQQLGIGLSLAYRLINKKKIRSGRIGRKIIIKQSALDEYIDSITQ